MAVEESYNMVMNKIITRTKPPTTTTVHITKTLTLEAMMRAMITKTMMKTTMKTMIKTMMKITMKTMMKVMITTTRMKGIIPVKNRINNRWYTLKRVNESKKR